MHITFDLFVDIREERLIVEKLLDKIVEIYFVFVSSKFVAIFMDVFVNNSF